MTEHWNFYMCRVDGEPVSIYLDLGLAEKAPHPGFDHVVHVFVNMRMPRDDGLSSSEEYDALLALEDDLVQGVEAAGPVIYAGRCTGHGHRAFYFYVGEGTSLDDCISGALAQHKGYAFKIGHRADPDWRCYFDFLYPDDDALEAIRERDEIAVNQQVRDALGERGDDGSAPREIMHWAYFADQASRDRFQMTVAESGFAIEQADHADGRYLLRFSRDESPTALDPVTGMLRKMALACGGDYDGWECPVCP